MKEPSTYNEYIIRSILVNNRFGIRDIRSVEDIKSLCLIREEYTRIVELIKNKDIEAIKGLKPSPIRTSEHLSIMKVTDGEGKEYIVTGYDNDELTQDPQVIDIFPIQ